MSLKIRVHRSQQMYIEGFDIHSFLIGMVHLISLDVLDDICLVVPPRKQFGGWIVWEVLPSCDLCG